MGKDKKLIGVSIDNDVVCLLETLCGEFKISKSQLVELLVLKLGFNRFSNAGLDSAWELHYFTNDYINKYISEFDNVTDLVDLL